MRCRIVGAPVQDGAGRLGAGSKDATGASMGLSDDENMQFQAMQKMFLGGALHGRKRFAIYDVANSRLAFADADGQRFKNIAEARCMAN
ncbi:hypothetical protein EN792_053560 [Mesorhizobium sp. M00.F.Ca.ET.149.01.1.1]|nr:hypothetical protein EN792_053560 [Mesorhizobium sp. M00.F.Ca.ET.149.01.1.1]